MYTNTIPSYTNEQDRFSGSLEEVVSASLKKMTQKESFSRFIKTVIEETKNELFQIEIWRSIERKFLVILVEDYLISLLSNLKITGDVKNIEEWEQLPFLKKWEGVKPLWFEILFDPVDGQIWFEQTIREMLKNPQIISEFAASRIANLCYNKHRAWAEENLDEKIEAKNIRYNSNLLFKVLKKLTLL